jgi:hypothetical protein
MQAINLAVFTIERQYFENFNNKYQRWCAATLYAINTSWYTEIWVVQITTCGMTKDSYASSQE